MVKFLKEGAHIVLNGFTYKRAVGEREVPVECTELQAKQYAAAFEKDEEVLNKEQEEDAV